MCGRIGKFGPAALAFIDEYGLDAFYRLFQDAAEKGRTGRNIKPTEQVAFIRAGEVLVGRWGLEPVWARDPKTVKGLLFNARAESASEKPSFRDAMRRSRCVVPVSGFYEWQAVPGASRKQPWWIDRADGQTLLLAGLYAVHDWGASFTILTTSPNKLMGPIHDRMPVVLDPITIERWLDPTLTDPTAVEDLLGPCPVGWLRLTALDAPVEVWEPGA